MSNSSNPGSRAPRNALDAALSGTSGDPVRRALWLDAMDLQLRAALPSTLAAHARLANIDGEKLVLLVNSPVWRARMRLAAPDLLRAARSIGLEVRQLVVKTSLLTAPHPGGDRPPRPRSAAAGRALRDALDCLEADPAAGRPQAPSESAK
ncbi:MAG TPA: DUF721 domain-containing protein [Xanthomonadaceae bacterium]|nr:DUF721 domain-containing protein [Xanthomonadaceae bacterium]